MTGTHKNREAFKLVMVCIIASLCVWTVYGFIKVFSLPGTGVASSGAPVPFDFSSAPPKSPAGSTSPLAGGYIIKEIDQ